MGRVAKAPPPEIARDLRRLAARRDRQADALQQTRRELDSTIRRALRRGATPQGVAVLVGLDRATVANLRPKKEGR